MAAKEHYDKEAILAEVDLVDLIKSHGVNLRKHGMNYKGLCLFHADKKTASLSVSREKGLWHCFGCDAGGDAIDFVSRLKGLEFPQALAYLGSLVGNGKLEGASAEKQPVEAMPPMQATPPMQAMPPMQAVPPVQATQVLTSTGSPVITLEEVCAYYHKQLYNNPLACAYLEERGLGAKELHSRFRLGYCDGSLVRKLSSSQCAQLQSLGILRDTGKEHFAGYLVFPFTDNEDKVVSFYGRSLAGINSFPHLYLPGSHCGVFNRKASKVYDQIILTESVIDALSLIALGLQNVQPIYGTNGFTAEHQTQLEADRVKGVILSLDNDKAGRQACDKLAGRLLAAGFRVQEVYPEAKDWNEELRQGKDGEELKKLFATGQWQEPAEATGGFEVVRDENTYRFKMGQVTYRVSKQKEVFVMNLKVTIKAESDREPFYDTIDLYQSRGRSSFAGKLAQHLEAEPRRIEKDLVRILEYLEDERDRVLSGPDGSPETVILSEEEKRLGLEFLTDPQLFDLVAEHMSTLGYVEEKTNKLLVYLAAASRVFAHPLNVYIQSSSSGGKTALLDTLEMLLPPEDIWKANTISDQALHYVEDSYYQGKVFVMGEAVHDEKIEALIRQMQSDGEISRLVTRKDEQTEKMRAEIVTKKVQMSFMLTSTALQLNPENASRCLILAVDESAEQTKRIHRRIGFQHSYAGKLGEKPQRGQIIKTHRAAWRLLEPLCVCNPYWQHIRFPAARLSMRRAYQQFLVIIDTVCYLRQKQKTVLLKPDPESGRQVRSIECDLTDYQLAYRLFTCGVLAKSWEEIPQGTRVLYAAIRELVSGQAARTDLKAEEVIFIQKQIRDHTGYGREFVKKHLKLLVDYEYLKVTSGRSQGTSFAYRLRDDLPIEEMDIRGITTPEELEKQLSGGDR